MLTKSKKTLTAALAALALTTGLLAAVGEASARPHGFHGSHFHHGHHFRHYGRWYGGGGSCWVYTRVGLVNICDDDDD
jgi:hypothetical protein